MSAIVKTSQTGEEIGEPVEKVFNDTDNNVRDQVSGNKPPTGDLNQQQTARGLSPDQKKIKTELENKQWLEQSLLPLVQPYMRMPEFQGMNILENVKRIPEVASLLKLPHDQLAQKATQQQVGIDVTTPKNLAQIQELIKGHLDSIRRARRTILNKAPQTVNMTNKGVRAFNFKSYKVASQKVAQQIMQQQQTKFPVATVGEFIDRFLPDILKYDGQETENDQISGQAISEIQVAVGQGFEQEANSALKSLAEKSTPDIQADPIREGARILTMIYEQWLSPNVKTEKTAMADKIPGIIKHDLSAHVLNNQGLVKTAADHFGQEYMLYGPSEKRICPKLRGKGGGPPGSNDVVSEYICRHHCLDGIVLDDHKTICGEAIFRAHVMEKQTAEYIDADGKVAGGIIEKRFEVNHNIPEETNMHLKPGERRKPRAASQGNLEARMQDMREKEGEKRGYRPTTDKTKPFNWAKDVDQNNMDPAQKERNRRETASGHQLVEYKNQDAGENNLKSDKTASINNKFNLKQHKQAQFNPFAGEDMTATPSPEFTERRNRALQNDPGLNPTGPISQDEMIDNLEDDESDFGSDPIEDAIDPNMETETETESTGTSAETANSIEDLFSSYGQETVFNAIDHLGLNDERFTSNPEEELPLLKEYFKIYDELGPKKMEFYVNKLGFEGLDNPDEFTQLEQDPNTVHLKGELQGQPENLEGPVRGQDPKPQQRIEMLRRAVEVGPGVPTRGTPNKMNDVNQVEQIADDEPISPESFGNEMVAFNLKNHKTANLKKKVLV